MCDLNSNTENIEGKKLLNAKLYVRYMVSSKCKKLVKTELNYLDIKYTISSHGAIEFLDVITQDEFIKLKGNLQKFGLSLLDVQKSKLIDRIILSISEIIHSFDKLPAVEYQEIINDKLDLIDQPIIKIFSDVMGMSIIQFIVLQKIERIKVHLLYDDLPLSEIANILNYRNEQLLIAQFKKISGLTPDKFLELKRERSKIISHSLNKSTGERSSSLNL